MDWVHEVLGLTPIKCHSCGAITAVVFMQEPRAASEKKGSKMKGGKNMTQIDKGLANTGKV